jgi:hypothetical protein
MTNNSYRQLAPVIQQLVDAGEMSEQYARQQADRALILVDFITKIATCPEVTTMFQANDRDHFIEGLQHSAWFQTEFTKYIADLRREETAA